MDKKRQDSSHTFAPSGLEVDHAEEVAGVLQDRLADLIDLSLTLKHVHWNVVGFGFIAIHKLMDEQVEVVRDLVDATAERIATLGGSPAGLIDQVAALLHAHARADIATLAARIDQIADLNDPNNVKVACDAGGRALYFSRAPIPWNRDAVNTLTPASLRHIGIYAYRVAALRRLASLPASRLEQIEKLEQLRALENGMEIRVALACERPLADVNTAADLERAERALSVRP